MRGLLTMMVWMMATPAFAAKIVLVAGGGEGKDGSPATMAKLTTPFGCDFDSKGRMYFVEFEKGGRLRTIQPDATIRTLAGSHEKGDSGDNQKAIHATFNGLHGLAVNPNDTVSLADTWNNRIRIFYPNKNNGIDNYVEAFIGSNEKGYEGDNGPGGDRPDPMKFNGVYAICFDPAKKFLYIADLDNHRVRKLNGEKYNIVSIAGNGKKGVPADGKKATDEPLFDPRAVAADRDGNIYILERSAHCLRVVDKDGIIKTVMGTGKAGTAVGNALESQMNGPKHLCVDKDGSVIIADSENHRILRYIPKEEKVVVIAGTGKKGSAGLDGDPLKCELNRPHGVCVHPKTGELYICDSYNDRILKIVP